MNNGSSGDRKGEQPTKAPKPYRDWKDKLEIGLVVVATISAIVAAIFAVFAASDTSEQAATARDQVKIAEASLKEIKASTRKELRAYVFAKPYPFINEIRAGADTHTRVNYRNSGQTPASDLAFRGNIKVGNEPPRPLPTVFQNTQNRSVKTFIDPRTDINVGPEVRRVVDTTADEVAAIRDGKQRVFVWGILSYDDVFGEIRHHTYFCFVYGGLSNTPDFQQHPKSAARFQGTCRTPRAD